MSPAIPSGARLRVRLLGENPCNSGDVVFYMSEDGFMVHRIAHPPRGSTAGGYLLTIGDDCLAPDPPVRINRLLGTVVAVQTCTGWRPPGPALVRTSFHRLVRAATIAATIVALWFGVATARRFAAFLSALERVLRPLAGRLLRVVRHVLFHARLESAIRPLVRLVDRARHRTVRYIDLDVALLNALIPLARRQEVARAIAGSVMDTGRPEYFGSLTSYNSRDRELPHGIPPLNDLHPPNFAVLDFLARHVTRREDEVLLDFACGLGSLLVYERDLGFTRVYGFDNWTYLARSTAEQFLRRFGLPESVLVKPEDLSSIPVTIVTCIGFPLTLLAETSNLLEKSSVRYVLADRIGRPAILPGYQRAGEYADLLTIYQKTGAR